jgi:hypothetical protein
VEFVSPITGSEGKLLYSCITDSATTEQMAEIILLPLHILLRIQSVACNFKWAFILSIFEI